MLLAKSFRVLDVSVFLESQRRGRRRRRKPTKKKTNRKAEEEEEEEEEESLNVFGIRSAICYCSKTSPLSLHLIFSFFSLLERLLEDQHRYCKRY
jgi:hypothetical protein